jgi:hypothetical protein
MLTFRFKIKSRVLFVPAGNGLFSASTPVGMMVRSER